MRDQGNEDRKRGSMGGGRRGERKSRTKQSARRRDRDGDHDLVRRYNAGHRDVEDDE